MFPQSSDLKSNYFHVISLDISKLYIVVNSYELLNVYYVAGIVLSTQSLSHSIFTVILCEFNKFHIIGYSQNVFLPKP